MRATGPPRWPPQARPRELPETCDRRRRNRPTTGRWGLCRACSTMPHSTLETLEDRERAPHPSPTGVLGSPAARAGPRRHAQTAGSLPSPRRWLAGDRRFPSLAKVHPRSRRAPAIRERVARRPPQGRNDRGHGHPCDAPIAESSRPRGPAGSGRRVWQRASFVRAAKRRSRPPSRASRTRVDPSPDRRRSSRRAARRAIRATETARHATTRPRFPRTRRTVCLP